MTDPVNPRAASLKTAQRTVSVDDLPPTAYLVVEVLAARWRLGEPSWTFPTRFGSVLRSLEVRGIVDYQADVMPGALRAWFTPTARDAALSPTYTPPANTVASGVVGESRTTLEYGLRLLGTSHVTPLGRMDREWADREFTAADGEAGMAGRWRLVQRPVTTGPWSVAP